MQILRHCWNSWFMFAFLPFGFNLFGEDSPPTQVITKLDAEDFEERQEAYATLEQMGEDARKALEKALAANPQLEAREAIKRLLRKLPPRNVVYAKVLISGAPEVGDCCKVESWILKDLKLCAECKLHAITDWHILTEGRYSELWKHPVCGCPVCGSVERKKGNFYVSFEIPSPIPVPVHDNVVSNELGARAVTIVGDDKEHPFAYVALLVMPVPSHNAACENEEKTDTMDTPFTP